MKLSDNTINVLKNFSDINPNLIINPGNTLITINNSKTIYARGQIVEYFDTQFGIYDLKEFLSVLSICESPELNFMTTEDGQSYVDITDTTDPSIHTKYWSSNVNILTSIPKIKELPESEVVFMLSDLNFKRIEKACQTLKCPDVRFKTENGHVKVIVFDSTNANINTFTSDLGEYAGPEFNVHLNQEKMKIVSGDYKISVIGQAIRCQHDQKSLEYILALDV